MFSLTSPDLRVDRFKGNWSWYCIFCTSTAGWIPHLLFRHFQLQRINCLVLVSKALAKYWTIYLWQINDQQWYGFYKLDECFFTGIIAFIFVIWKRIVQLRESKEIFLLECLVNRVLKIIPSKRRGIINEYTCHEAFFETWSLPRRKT